MLRLGWDGPAVVASSAYRPVRCLCDKDCFGTHGVTPQSHVAVTLAGGEEWVVPRGWLHDDRTTLPAAPIPMPAVLWQDRPKNAVLWAFACWANAACAKGTILRETP